MNYYKYDFEKWVKLNGNKQNIRIRSRNMRHPIILFIHGGPGMCDRHNVLHYQSELAKEYTLVMWDQRGAGKSYYRGIKKDKKLCCEDYVQDARALVEYLCKKYRKDKIIIFGRSWGTIVGTELVSRYPEHIAAYIGQGQFVEGGQNELISYEYVLKEAKKHRNRRMVRALKGNAPVDGVYPSHDVMMVQRDGLTMYGGANWNNRGGLVESMVKPLVKYEGYHLRDLRGYAEGALYLSDYLWPQVVKYDFLKTVHEIKVPVLLTIGRHDYNTPFELAEKWYDQLDAPVKKWVWFEESAHSPITEEPVKWRNTVKDFLESLKLEPEKLENGGALKQLKA